MKTLKISLLALIIGAALVSCKNEPKVQEDIAVAEESITETNSNEVAGNIEKATFQIEGMTCALGCAKMIETKLSGLSGVSEAKVDFDTKTATVVFDDAKQNEESIVNTVQKIANGMYKVDSLKIEKDIVIQ